MGMRSKREHARKLAEGSMQKASKYAEVMAKIREATGVHHIGDVVHKFLNREARIKKSKNRLEEEQKKVNDLYRLRQELQAELDETKEFGVTLDRKTSRLMDAQIDTL